MSEMNKALVRRAVEDVWNQADYAALDELVASDFLIHGATPDAEIHGREGAAQFFVMLRAAFPDLHFTIDDQIAERDRVVTRWTARGTHKGEFQGIPPTGKQVEFSGNDIDRIAGGKVVECWPGVDELGLLRQLGALPAAEAVRH
jgi:steroid delta-isomerase-like uncharacterized protein